MLKFIMKQEKDSYQKTKRQLLHCLCKKLQNTQALKKKKKKKSRFTLLPFYVEIQVDEKWAGEEEIV